VLIVVGSAISLQSLGVIAPTITELRIYTKLWAAMCVKAISNKTDRDNESSFQVKHTRRSNYKAQNAHISIDHCTRIDNDIASCL